ncbi:MAG: translation elongation factor Ts [Deltaproteobacteria bacterium]|nr:translation elongation factor Ts [Deltaproteobacteria bacterium]
MTAITASMVKELREITGAAMMDCKKALTECDGDLEESKEFLRKKGQSIANKKSSRETKEGAICIEQDGEKVTLVKIACETDFVARNENFTSFIQSIAKQNIEVEGEDLMEKTASGGPIKEQFIEAISKMGENIVYVEGVYWKAESGSQIGAYTHSNGKIGVLVELAAKDAKDTEKAKSLAKDIAMHIAATQVESISENDLDPSVIQKEKDFLIDQAKDSGKPMNIIEKMVEGRLKKFKKEICLMDQPFVKEPDKTIAQIIKDAAGDIGESASVRRFYKSSF